MTNLSKLDFDALDISGKNYLCWVLDAEIHLEAANLGNAIKVDTNTTPQDRAKAMIFLRHHLDKTLKDEYLTVKNPLELWAALADQFAHQTTVVLSKARYEWTHLRLQDYNFVIDYNSAMHRITSQLKLCGETIDDEMMLEKTFSTFHATNLLLQQQYRERGFKKYSELISCLLVAEQNNELLMKNHQSRPTGSQPFPEVHATFSSRHGNGRSGMHGNARARDQGGAHGHRNGQGRNHMKQLGPKNNAKINKGKDQRTRASNQMIHAPKNHDKFCHRCGSNNYWVCVCRIPQHLVDLYQASLNGNKAEINYINQLDHWESSEPLDVTPLNVSDFFVDDGDHIDDMIGGGVLDDN